MKKIILLFILIFNNLYANKIIYAYVGGPKFYKLDVDFAHPDPNYSTMVSCSYGGGNFYYQSNHKYPCSYIKYPKYPRPNSQCLKKYGNNFCTDYDHSGYQFYTSEIDLAYCIPPGDDWVWDTNTNAWVNKNNGEVKCPDGQKYNAKTQECEDIPECNLTCPADKQLDTINCVCKCYDPMVLDQTGHCIPNPDLNKSECESKGYVYVDASSFEVFTDLDKAIASLGGSGCFSKDWVNAKKDKLKAQITPENVLKSVINLLPLGKIYKLAKWTGLVDDVAKEVKDPKLLTDNKPIIETKYNPETGVYEPEISLEPRIEKLPEEKLFQEPENLESAEQIIKPTKELDDFLRSKFAEVDTDEGLTQAVTAYNLEKNPAQTAVIDDLRDIFKRSQPETQEQHFPVVIDDIVSGEPINAQVTRQVTPVSTEGETKTYNITYNITPQGAKIPLPVVYQAQVSPDPQDSRKQVVKVIPKYNIENKTVTGTEIKNIYNIKNTTITSTPTEQNIPKPDLTSFGPLAQNEINNALNYKINLFTCPPATPKCPNDLVINYDLAGVKGQYKLPDITCAVINAIDNPNISPVVDKAATLIVLFATAVGFLSLLRRD